jgi:hypothetical protein
MDLVKKIYVSDLILNAKNDETDEQICDEQIYENLNDECLDDKTKKIIFTGTNTKYQMKKVDAPNKKEKKKRVETNTWGLNDTELSFETQLKILKNIHIAINSNLKSTSIISKSKDIKLEKDAHFIASHIKTKISSYKQQDLLKNIFLQNEFVSFEYIVSLLNDCDLKCHYCSCETYLLYELVREMKQWSLDRIDNDIGHNKNNLVISCLECNLKRRRTNKDNFFMTKNLKITREGLSQV